MRDQFRSIALLIGIISLGLLACDLGALSAGKPTTIITSPPSGSQFREGDDVAIQSTSTDSAGIVRVELAVDSNVVRTDSAPTPQVSFSQVQTWKATPGNHTVTVRAFNASGNASEPAAISISVRSASGATPGQTAAPPVQSPPAVTTGTIPTSTVAAGGTPSATAVGACTNLSAFVADVTVPDGTSLAAGQTFNKIWRLRNSGTCTWGPGYQLVFAGGEAMTTTNAAVVPSTAPGATADLLIPMTAPAAPGVHTGRWQLKNPAGQLFGIQVNVTINTVTAPPTQPPSSSCVGNPAIASFTAQPTTIAVGQSATLSYGLVSNADSAEIDPGIGGVTTPGSVVVTPTVTTVYTMTARCGANTRTAQVTVTVTPGGTPSAMVLDLVASAPSATWYSGANDLASGYLTWGDPANENATNPQGFMRWSNSVKLEDGSTVARALEMRPKTGDNGFIVGIYSIPTVVQPGTHFKARYGFANGATGKVEFIMGLVIGGTPSGGGNQIRLFQVTKQPTGSLLSADYDLTSYIPQATGQTMQIFLHVVAANPGGAQDSAMWIAPRLEK